MDIEIIRDETPRARKDYNCNASQALFEGYVYPDDFTDEEIVILFETHSNNSMIKKGEIYSKQTNKIDGNINTFRARPEVLPIYFKYECNEI